MRRGIRYTKHRFTHARSLSGIASVILFFSLFNGIVAYVVPLVMDAQGFSKSLLGLLYASSSIIGALFDLVMSRVLKTTHYRRMFLLMFVIALAFPLVLWNASHPLLFILAMGLWGLYYDFYMFGKFDFAGRLPHEQHASGWGTMNAAQSAGFVFSPLIAGYTLSEVGVGNAPYLIAILFLGISFFIFYTMYYRQPERPLPAGHHIPSVAKVPDGFASSFRRWKIVGTTLAPALLLTLFLNMLDSFFWVIGPLISQAFEHPAGFEGILVSAYFLPALFVGRFLNQGSRRYGKKYFAFFTCLAGSMLLIFFGSIENFFLLLGLVFISSAFFAVSWPAINGAYADYIEEYPELEKDIEATEDFAANAGYVIGPITAGLLTHWLGNDAAFVGIGIIGITVSVVLLIVTPRKIRLNVPAARIAQH